MAKKRRRRKPPESVADGAAEAETSGTLEPDQEGSTPSGSTNQPPPVDRMERRDDTKSKRMIALLRTMGDGANYEKDHALMERERIRRGGPPHYTMEKLDPARAREITEAVIEIESAEIPEL